MTDNNSAPESQVKNPAKDDGLSFEDVDKLLEEEDPNFNKDMAEIRAVGIESGAVLEDFQAKSEDNSDGLQNESKMSRAERVREAVIKLFQRAKQFSKIRIMNLKNRMLIFAEATKNFVLHELPDRIRYLKSRAIALLSWTAAQVGKFKALTQSEKTGVALIFLGSVMALFFLSRTIVGGWLPSFHDPLIHSFSNEVKKVESVKSRADMQEFFEAFPEVEIQILLKKVTVNLRVDPESTNSMGIFEFYLGVDSQDTAIEVKDREREILDIVQRALEKFDYNEVNSTVGKIRMKSAIRDRINEILNQGQVFHVYFNNFVINH